VTPSDKGMQETHPWEYPHCFLPLHHTSPSQSLIPQNEQPTFKCPPWEDRKWSFMLPTEQPRWM